MTSCVLKMLTGPSSGSKDRLWEDLGICSIVDHNTDHLSILNASHSLA